MRRKEAICPNRMIIFKLPDTKKNAYFNSSAFSSLWEFLFYRYVLAARSLLTCSTQ